MALSANNEAHVPADRPGIPMAKPSSNSNANPLSLDQNIVDRFVHFENGPRDPRSRTFSLPHTPPIPQLSLSTPVIRPHQTPAIRPDADSDISHTATHRIACAGGDLWLTGSSLFCACPDCSAPMTIRIWLELADCWQCGSSVSLSAEQSRAARKLSEHLQQPQAHPRAPLTTLPPITAMPAGPQPSLSLDSAVASAEQRELESLSRGSSVARILRRGFRLTPAWIISFIIHLIVVLLLALIMLRSESVGPPSIVLSTFLSSEREEGGTVQFEDLMDALRDNMELANDFDESDQDIKQILESANRDAQDLIVDPDPVTPLADLNEIKKNITTKRENVMSFAARDPRVRAEIVQKEGGTSLSEAAVARGLRWLASVQNQDGGWSLKNYQRHNRKNNKSDVMATSLALLPMLGAGQTHEFGIYKKNVAAGLAWLLENQKPNGDLRAGFNGEQGMYAHGQATIVICEALALTGDQKLRIPAEQGARFIESAQHAKGGWRYRPGEIGDTSVFGWQMMALQSARAPDLNLNVDDATLKLADYFLDQVIAPARFNNRRKTRLPNGAAYCYMPGRKATPTMTAEAILCRMYLGWEQNDPRLDSAVKWLVEDHLPDPDEANLYYWYYGTQVMHHYGGKPWDTWNAAVQSILITTQNTGGSYPGSWTPRDFEWGIQGGRIYTTSLAVCTLEVYYRHLPLFQQIELDE